MRCVIIATLVMSVPCAAQSVAMSAVQARCARLEQAVQTATGQMRDGFAQWLDDCRAEVVRLTPPKPPSKLAMVAADSASILAIGQEIWAGHQNMHTIDHMRPKQRGIGTYEFNIASEGFVGGVIGEGLGVRWWKRWHHKSVPVIPLDVTTEATDAVVMPH